MLFVYLALFGLAFWKIKFSGKGFFAEESVARDVTDSIKGIFIWLVFLSHFASYVTYTARIDMLGYKISGTLGQLIVACFLFYSGYGVSEAIRRKGAEYVRPFPKNRVLKTLIHFDLAVLLFLAVGFVVGNRYPVTRILLSFLGWEAIGNSNWYIFVVIVLYLFTWIAFTLVKKNTKLAALAVTFLTFGLIVFLKYTKEIHWYDTALCYVLGMWFSIFKENIFKVVTKGNLLWAAIVAVLFCGLVLCFVLPDIPLFNFASLLGKPLLFCLLIAAVLMKFKVSNPILSWSGRYTFELYILQRIPMILLKHWSVADVNIYLYFALSLVLTILLALGFRCCLNRVDNLFFAKKN